MKEFSLEAFKNGAQVVTRSGREVEILHTGVRAAVPGYTIVGLVKYEALDKVVSWASNGEFIKGESSPLDLVLKSNKAWVNILRSPKGVRYPSRLFKTYEDATRSMTPNTIDTIEIEWEDVEYEEG